LFKIRANYKTEAQVFGSSEYSTKKPLSDGYIQAQVISMHLPDSMEYKQSLVYLSELGEMFFLWLLETTMGEIVLK